MKAARKQKKLGGVRMEMGIAKGVYVGMTE